MKDIMEENNDRRNVKLLLGMLKRIDSEMEIFWRASVMARGGRVDSSRWNKLQKEMDKARLIMARVERENAETEK